MTKVNHLEDIIITDSSKLKVKIIFDIINSFGGKDRYEVNGILTKEINLFKFIKETEYNMISPINVIECFVEKNKN